MLLRLLGAVLVTALFLSPAHAAFDAGDIICETSTTTGTGTLNLAGAVTNYATFVSQITSGSSVNYHITASDGKLETGVGVLTDATPDTLTRVAYWSSDGSGAELTLPAGTHTVCLGPTVQMFAGMKGIQLYTDDAGAVGGVLPFWHDSATPADGDIAGEIQVWGGADDEEIGQIRMEVDDGATTTEDTQWQHVLRRAGSDLTALTLGTTGFNGYAHVFDMGSAALGGLYVQNNAAGATEGPGIMLYQDSADPAADDLTGYIDFLGEDSGSNQAVYNYVHSNIVDPTDGSEDGKLAFGTRVGGSFIDSLTLSDTSLSFDASYNHVFRMGSTASAGVVIQNTNANASGPELNFHQDSATPAANDLLAAIVASGDDSGGNQTGYSVIAFDLVDPTNGSEDGQVRFRNRVAGAVTDVLALGNDSAVAIWNVGSDGCLYSNNATSTNAGNCASGQINADAVYDDNVALTSMPLSDVFEDTGTFDTQVWDAKAPDGKHEAAHVFKDMLDEGFDPKDTDQWLAKMREDNVLPGMPTEAEWNEHGPFSIGALSSRMWLTLDMIGLQIESQQKKIEELEARIQALEAKLQ